MCSKQDLIHFYIKGMDPEKVKHEVLVTHFVNPQLFWFHIIGISNDKLERDLLAYYKMNTPQAVGNPQVGTVVVVKYLPWKTYIRGKVLSNINVSKYSNEYIVWAMDYGFPLQTNAEYLYAPPVHQKLIMEKENYYVRRGGISEIYAAEKELNFAQGCGVVTRKDTWHPRAIEVLEKLINDAKSVLFFESFRTGDHLWGDLRIVNREGKSFSARQILIDKNYALEAGPNFRGNCLSLKATEESCWASKIDNNKLKFNDHIYLECSDLNTSHENYFDMARKRIEDWHARNERADAKWGAERLESAETSHNNISAVDDYACDDDSVSTTHDIMKYENSSVSVVYDQCMGSKYNSIKLGANEYQQVRRQSAKKAIIFYNNEQPPEHKGSSLRKSTTTKPSSTPLCKQPDRKKNVKVRSLQPKPVHQFTDNCNYDSCLPSSERYQNPVTRQELTEINTIFKEMKIYEPSTCTTTLLPNKSQNQPSDNHFAGIQMIPAGFDLARLCHKKNKKKEYHEQSTL